MALKALDIFKLTPKKNCKDCGFPTCMAFCMKVASGAVEVEKCPHMSDEALAKLSEATAPLMRGIKVGSGTSEYELGAETVLFRHEKTLVNRNRYAVAFDDSMTNEQIDFKIANIKAVNYIRIGEEMKAEMAKPQTMDLFAMLQLYFDQRNAGAYSQRAKVNNLKEYSELCQYLLDHGITDITALENHVNDLRTTTDSLKKKLDAQTAQMKTLRKIPEYFDDYKRLKPVFDGLQKIKFTKAREKYKAEHTNDLKRFYEAQRIISQKFPDGKFDRKVLEAEYEELERQHDATYAEFKTIRAESQQLWKIKSHIDTARKAMGYSLEHQSKKQEQEI